MIRLHMSEMPYPPPEHVIRAAETGLQQIHRYADPAELERLKKALAEYTGLPARRIVLGPGSDYLLRDLVLSFGPQRTLLLLSPSFLPTVQAAKQAAGKIVHLRLSPPDFRLKPQALLEELKGASLLIFENPNNPTGGLLLDRPTLEAALAATESLVVVDEAYFEFSDITFADLVPQYPNLAVTRTLDKGFGLAGARIGYLLAGDRFLEAFASFSALLPQASLKAAIAALENQGYKDEHIRMIKDERERLRKALIQLGFQVGESATNFLLLQSKIPDIALQLKERGVLVADLSGQMAAGSIRISVGTPHENDTFVKILQDIMQK